MSPPAPPAATRLRAADRWVAAIALCALLWRLAWLGAPSLWFDEALELHRVAGGLVDALRGGPLDHDPPLLPLFLYGWWRLGNHDAWLRLPSVLAGAGAVLVTGLWAGRLFGPRIGRLAALMMAVAPVQVYYSQELNQYAWLLLFTALSLYCLEDVRERGARGDWLRYGAVAGLGLATHYGFAFVVAAQWVYLAWWGWRGRRATGIPANGRDFEEPGDQDGAGDRPANEFAGYQIRSPLKWTAPELAGGGPVTDTGSPGQPASAGFQERSPRLQSPGDQRRRPTWAARPVPVLSSAVVLALALALEAALLWFLGLGTRLAVPHAVRRWGWPDLANEWAFFHDVFWREVLVFYLLPFSGGLALPIIRILAGAVLLGAVWLWRTQAAGRRAVTVGFLLPLALTYLASGWALYPFGYRHGLFVTPALLTALAAALAWLWGRRRAAGVVATVAVAAVFLAFAPQRFWDNPWMAPPREDMRAVTRELTARWAPGDTVYVYDPARYAFEHYWRGPRITVTWGQPFAGAEVIHEAWRVNRAPGHRAWLVFAHVEGDEDDRLVNALVDRGWRETDRIAADGAFAVRMVRGEGGD